MLIAQQKIPYVTANFEKKSSKWPYTLQNIFCEEKAVHSEVKRNPKSS